jgi:hypothetical protein
VDEINVGLAQELESSPGIAHHRLLHKPARLAPILAAIAGVDETLKLQLGRRHRPAVIADDHAGDMYIRIRDRPEQVRPARFRGGGGQCACGDPTQAGHHAQTLKKLTPPPIDYLRLEIV